MIEESQRDAINRLAERIKSGEISRIIAATGAGISTSAGIVDFRSPGGLFEIVTTQYGERFPEIRAEPEYFFTRRFRYSHADLQDSIMADMKSTVNSVVSWIL